MSLINRLIIRVNENGLAGLFYQSAVVISFLAVLIFFEFYRRRFGLKRSEGIAALVIAYPLSYIWMLVLTWVQNGFRDFGDNNMVRLYIWVPLFILLAAKILNRDARMLTDFFAPAAALVQAIGHTTCVFPGCCHGYPCSWGIVNYPLSQELWSEQLQKGGYVFTVPVQWLECLVALGVFFAVKIYTEKTGFDGRGNAYPLFLILFGATRFALEFLRDNEKLFWGISELALHALSMVAVGVVWLLLCRKYPKKAVPNHVPEKHRKTKAA